MSHQIKVPTLLIVITGLAALTACGDSSAERAAKERERLRLETEQQEMRDLQKSNQAVSDISKKLGRKIEPMDLGVPTSTNSSTTMPKK